LGFVFGTLCLVTLIRKLHLGICVWEFVFEYFSMVSHAHKYNQFIITPRTIRTLLGTEKGQLQGLKTHTNSNRKRARQHKNHQNLLKPMHLCTKAKRKDARTTTHTRILTPGRPNDKNNGLHAPTQLRLARTHGTHDTHETKTKTKRSRSPGHGGRTSRSISPKPLIYIYIYT
jgi:hypothetical protein